MDMTQMLPLMMMMGRGGSGSKDGGEKGPDMELLMRMMAPDMFAEEIEPIWEDGVTVGHAKDKNGIENVGVLSVRLLPPTMNSAKPSLRLTTSGLVICRPAELAKVGAFLQGCAQRKIGEDTLEKAYADAMAMEDTLGPQRQAMQAAKMMR